MRAYLLVLSLLVAGPLYGQTEAPACGSDAPCETAHGSYHLRLPEGWTPDKPLPLVVFFHGHRASGRMIFRNGGLKQSFLDHGYAVLAPNGVPISDGSTIFAWPARDRGPDVRDDLAFVDEVLEDVTGRWPIDQDKIYATGFSAGGSMAWQLACYRAERYAGFAAVAGTLRQPQQTETCPDGPVRLLQIHGYSDNQVPFEGRQIRDWHQGDLFAALDKLRGRNGCRTHADTIETEGTYWCRAWSDSCETGALELCVHPGGHGIPRGWADLAREFFETP